MKVSESVTGTDGSYFLDGLVQGDFYFKFEIQNNTYGFTVSHATRDEMDSDVDGTFGYGSTKMIPKRNRRI